MIIFIYTSNSMKITVIFFKQIIFQNIAFIY